jgi:hypothetical protein
MRTISTPVAVLITLVLSALLLAYVFMGDSAADAKRAPHCTSRQALDQVKAELFRRAATLRGANDAEFTRVAGYSSLRNASRMVRRHRSASDKVSCSGMLALDLPPGVTAVGERRTLEAKLAYDLAPAGEGNARLLELGRADAIVGPLATIAQGGQTTQPVVQAPVDGNEAVALSAPVPAPPVTLQPPEPPRAKPANSAPRKAAPAAKPSVAKRAPTPPPAPVAGARPSFNCRYARTRGEIAVCRDPGLASLDRQMSAQFYRALAAARPGQRTMLQRSRTRFLSYRDSCGSTACMAEAYRGRMREISDIMSGSW